MLQQFWKCWSNEYLSGLRQRLKWCKLQRDIEVGDMVLIKNVTLPSLKWNSGRIKTVYHGKDEKVRVVNIRTSCDIKQLISKTNWEFQLPETN